MIPRDLAVLIDIVNNLSLIELAKAVSKTGYDIKEVLDILDNYTPEE